METSPGTPERRIVTAAGGLVLDVADGRTRILVVHRPAYGDWTLPKGHVDPGEELAVAARREVLEETGVHARVVAPLGATSHRVGESRKQVHWFLMQPEPGGADPADRLPDDEVDAAAWWPRDDAALRLTYANERDLVAAAADL